MDASELNLAENRHLTIFIHCLIYHTYEPLCVCESMKRCQNEFSNIDVFASAMQFVDINFTSDHSERTYYGR